MIQSARWPFLFFLLSLAAAVFVCPPSLPCRISRNVHACIVLCSSSSAWSTRLVDLRFTVRSTVCVVLSCTEWTYTHLPLSPLSAQGRGGGRWEVTAIEEGGGKQKERPQHTHTPTPPTPSATKATRTTSPSFVRGRRERKKHHFPFVFLSLFRPADPFVVVCTSV